MGDRHVPDELSDVAERAPLGNLVDLQSLALVDERKKAGPVRRTKKWFPATPSISNSNFKVAVTPIMLLLSSPATFPVPTLVLLSASGEIPVSDGSCGNRAENGRRLIREREFARCDSGVRSFAF